MIQNVFMGDCVTTSPASSTVYYLLQSPPRNDTLEIYNGTSDPLPYANVLHLIGNRYTSILQLLYLEQSDSGT